MRHAGTLSFLLALAGQAYGRCEIKTTAGGVAPEMHDALNALLSQAADCPPDVQALRALLEADGMKLNPHMVGNRGFHNPKEGSFSFFERVTGPSRLLNRELEDSDFYFGHFTEATPDSELALAQSEGLMIELFVWDFQKQAYNFYELIGEENKRTWFYRGDSFDIFEDNRRLLLQQDPAHPIFGQTLRCSGCHASGGPILKELVEPHNDWWRTERPLLLAQRPNREVQKILENTQDASVLARSVRLGIDRLEKSPTVRAVKEGTTPLPGGRHYSWREALRPLFGTVEINLESDSASDAENSRLPTVQIPSASLSDPRLGTAEIKVSRALYLKILLEEGARFPENGRLDADHAWLVPVKSYSDRRAIEELVERKLLDEDFALAVLAVDSDEVLFSAERLKLLRAVPEKWTPNWQAEFLEGVKAMRTSPDPLERKAAQSLMANLERGSAALKRDAQERLDRIQISVETESGLREQIRRLFRLRQSVFDNEISKNPRGQILEPGFRVIFPKARAAPAPAKTQNCETKLK
jgi:hypothetical protein